MENIYNREDYQSYINFIYGRKQPEPEEEKFYKADMHVHCEYSYDSKMSIESIINHLKNSKIKCIGLADHVNFAYEAPPYVVEKLKRRNAEIDRIQETTGITILKGIEVGEPHLYLKEMAFLDKITDTDFTIGSIHEIKTKPLRALVKDKNLTKKYFKEILNMIKNAPIDIVGHLDYLKRYIELDETSDELYEILSEIIRLKLTLEINTSGIRRCSSTFPDPKIIDEYIKIGGRNVTYGSDAHNVTELGENIENLSKDNKKLTLTQGIFVNHNFKRI